jgi:hypothetical protein
VDLEMGNRKGSRDWNCLNGARYWEENRALCQLIARYEHLGEIRADGDSLCIELVNGAAQKPLSIRKPHSAYQLHGRSHVSSAQNLTFLVAAKHSVDCIVLTHCSPPPVQTVQVPPQIVPLFRAPNHPHIKRVHWDTALRPHKAEGGIGFFNPSIQNLHACPMRPQMLACHQMRKRREERDGCPSAYLGEGTASHCWIP